MAAGGRSLNQFLVKVISLWLLVVETFVDQSRRLSSSIKGRMAFQNDGCGSVGSGL